MMQELKTYTWEQIECIPHDVYVVLFQILCIVSVILIIWKGWKDGIRSTLWLILGEYLLLILCSTVLYREVADVHPVHLLPFWSYYENSTGQFEAEPEHVMNVLIFVPVGILISVFSKSYMILKVLLFGVTFSCFIEGSQYVFYRGVCEIDDVVNNSLGCVIGCLLYFTVKRIYRLYILYIMDISSFHNQKNESSIDK